MSIESSALRFTPDPQANLFVKKHFDLIVSRIAETNIKTLALVVAGSFGRGEGCVKVDNNSKLQAVNDYDIYLILSRPLSFLAKKKLRAVSQKLKAEIGIWHLDLMPISIDQLAANEIKMSLYDLKFASQVISGDAEILNFIPYSLESTISDHEILNLLINRQVTLLEGYANTNSAQHDHLARQIAKTFYALIDAVLIDCSAYAVRYKDKSNNLKIFAESSDKAKVLVDELDWIELARTSRIAAKDIEFNFLHTKWMLARQLLVTEIIALHKRILTMNALSTKDILANWRGHRPSLFTLLKTQIGMLILGKDDRYACEKDMFIFLQDFASHSDDRDNLSIKTNQLIDSWYNS